MNIITVKCSNPKCGKEFQTRNIFGGVNSSISFKDCHIGSCPLCFSPGILNATYRFDEEGVMSILSKPEFTPEVLMKLQHVAELAHANHYSREEFKEEVASVGIPQVFFNLFIPQDAGDFYSFLQFLLLLIPKLLRKKRSDVSKKPSSGKKKLKKRKKREQDPDLYKLRKDYNKTMRE